jgi:hypothetical protein
MMDRAEMVELLPCPFCGGKAITIPKPRGWTVECHRRFTLDDLCSVNLRTRYADTQAEAINIWNSQKAYEQGKSDERARVEKLIESVRDLAASNTLQQNFGGQIGWSKYREGWDFAINTLKQQLEGK